MKNENIRKINTMGKAGKIITNILIVLISIIIFFTIIGGFVSISIISSPPNDIITVKGTGTAEITVDNSKIPFWVDRFVDDEMEEINIHMFGVKLNVDKIEDSNDVVKYNASYDVNNFDIKDLAFIAPLAIFFAALVMAAFLVSMIFAYRLSSAFANCSSPFDEIVIKRMKQFAFSLIPWAALKFVDGVMGMTTAVVLVVLFLLAAYIFSYGAQLQRESDDTI